MLQTDIEQTVDDLDDLLSEFDDLNFTAPTKVDPAKQLADDKRAVAAARCHGRTSFSDLSAATALPPERLQAVFDAEDIGPPTPMDERDAKVLKAWNKGLRTASAIRNHTGIGNDRVRVSARRLKLTLQDGRPRAKDTPERRAKNAKRRVQGQKKRDDDRAAAVEACRGKGL